MPAELLKIVFSPLIFLLRGAWSVCAWLCNWLGKATLYSLDKFAPWVSWRIGRVMPAGGGKDGQVDAVSTLTLEAKRLAKKHADKVSDGQKLLLAGQRREYAQSIASEKKYPTLYQSIPEDLERSIVMDGRLLNGQAPAVGLAGLSLTPEFVNKAWAAAGEKARVVAAGVLVACMLTAIAVSGSMQAWKKLTAVAAETVAMQQSSRDDHQARMYAQDYEDIWTPGQVKEVEARVNVVDKSKAYGQVASGYATAGLSVTILMVLGFFASGLLAYAAGWVYFVMRFRGAVHAAVDSSVDPLRHAWREALQLWRYRIEKRDMEYQSYCDQVNFALNIDRSPLIDIGRCLGVMEFRKHLLAPQENQQMRMSVVDMLQHVSVIGGSGEGKSRDFYVPVVEQLLRLRKEGYPLAIFATDDKAVIHLDIKEACARIGIPEDDILTIGTGPDDYRVDLLDSLTPVDACEILASIAKQSGKEGADSFWPDMASDLLLQVATVLFVAEHTSAGVEWVRTNGMRMYSLINILRVCSNDIEIENALKIVCSALEDEGEEYRKIERLDKNGLHAAMDYLAYSWLPMIDATRDGIKANVRASLRGFAFREEIAAGFADGSGSKLISAAEISSNKIKCVAIMLKTMLYKQARAAEVANPAFAKERLGWWFNPRLGPDTGKYALNIFLADEFQGLITSSNDGMSDSQFWNVARSAAVGGILLSQSPAAYRLAIGDKPFDNIEQNWRTRIWLRTEHSASIDHAIKLAGKTMRFQTFEDHHMEGVVAARHETGTNVNCIERSEFTDQRMASRLSGGEFRFAAYQQAFELDTRFILKYFKGGPQGAGNADAVTGSQQAAHWRQEDRTTGLLQHGSSITESVDADDIMAMGRGRALVMMQRAGGTRVDFVRLNQH